MEKTIIYNLRLNGVDTAIENMAQLRELQKQYTRELENTKIGSQRYNELKGSLAAVKTAQSQFTEEIKQTQREQTKATTEAKGSYRALQAELTNLKKEYKELGNEAREGIYGRDLKTRIKSLSDDLKGIDKGLGDNQRNVGDYATAFAGGGAAGLLKFAGAAGIALGATTKLISIGTNLVEANNRQAQAEATLRQALQGRADVADRLIKQASAFQNSSLVGNEEIIKQQAYLASIGRTEEEIGKIIQTSLDYSAVTGQTLDGAVKNIAKTFGGLAGELAEVVPEIKTLTAEQLAAGAAVDLLNEKFQGQAEVASRVGSGPLIQLKNVFGDIQELLGKALGPAVTAIADKIRGLAMRVQDSVSSGGGFVKFQAGLVAVVEVFSILFERASAGVGVFRGLFQAVEAIGLLVQRNFTAAAAKGREAWDTLSTSVARGFDVIGDVERVKNSYNNALDAINDTAGASTVPVETGKIIGGKIAEGIQKELEAKKKAFETALRESLRLEEELADLQDKELDKKLKSDLEKIKNNEKRELELKAYYDELALELDKELAKEADELAKEDVDKIKRQNEIEIKEKIDAAKRIADERKRIAEEIESTIFDIAGQALSASIDRQRENLQRETEEKTAAVDAEYADRLAAAEGNAEETARLNKLIEAEKLKIKKQEFEENKKIAIKEALINGAIAAIQALSNTILPFPASLLALIPVAAQTALQIGIISSQSFAYGGYTGKSSLAPDRTGERPVGVVHEDEYVTPKKVLRTSRGRALVNQLEQIRMGAGHGSSFPGYYAEGGFTVPVSASGSNQPVVVQTGLSDSDIDRVLQAVENGSERGSARGSERGSTEGLTRAALEQQRDVQLMADLSI